MLWSSWWRQKQIKQKKWITKISLPFFILCLFAFTLAWGYNLARYLLTEDKKDIITNDLGILSQYVRVVSPASASLLKNLNILIQAYNQPYTNIFVDQKEIINSIWEQIHTQTQQLNQDNPQFARLVSFLDAIYPHKDELLIYLGSNVPKSYLVVLQNSSEKRPNGWFFGSFAYVRVLWGKIRTIHIIDSYLGYKTMPRVVLQPPARSDPFYRGEPYGRIAANKFWFTNMDGYNLIELYNKTFNDPQSEQFIPQELCKDICQKSIDGVVFINTASLEKLMPWLQKKLREWQFTNASVDILRGVNLPNKKEFYLSDSQKLFVDSMGDLVKNFFTKFDTITRQYNFWLYIPTISPGLNTVITHYNFTTIPNNQTVYTRDTNRAFNKSDDFVTKTTLVKNMLWDVVLDQTNNDQLDISSLQGWSYTLELRYRIDVPVSYRAYINQLEEQYHIKLTDRELGILVLKPVVDGAGVERLWETKSQVYFPDSVVINSITWDYTHNFFTSPFWPWVDYLLGTSDNLSSRSVSINFTLNK